jgi:hypothetical protein
MRLCCVASVLCFLFIPQVILSSEPSVPSQPSRDEQTLWNLEHAYWRYVQENDLSSYSNLWHKDFLGWPSVSAAPVHKDHITEWITAQTSKGLVFKNGEFKPAAVQVTGDVAMVCYWITFKMAGQGWQWRGAHPPYHAHVAQDRKRLAHYRWNVHAGAQHSARLISQRGFCAFSDQRSQASL